MLGCVGMVSVCVLLYLCNQLWDGMFVCVHSSLATSRACSVVTGRNQLNPLSPLTSQIPTSPWKVSQFMTTLSYWGEYNPSNNTGKAWGFASKAGQCLMLSSFQEDNILIWHTYIMHFTANLCHKYLSFMSCACIHAALDLAFSSLYRDEVHLVESEICSIIAAASMLQLVSGHTSTLIYTCGYRTIFAITL